MRTGVPRFRIMWQGYLAITNKVENYIKSNKQRILVKFCLVLGPCIFICKSVCTSLSSIFVEWNIWPYSNWKNNLHWYNGRQYLLYQLWTWYKAIICICIFVYKINHITHEIYNFNKVTKVAIDIYSIWNENMCKY